MEMEKSLHVFLSQADADGLCTVLGDPFTKDEVDRPLSSTIDRSVFEQAGWIINRDDITVSIRTALFFSPKSVVESF
jgi:hypothetical protein